METWTCFRDNRGCTFTPDRQPINSIEDTMEPTVRISSSISLLIPGGGTVTLDGLQSFVEQARAMGVPKDKPLKTTLNAPYQYDQSDRDPGSFIITADATGDQE